LDYEIPIPLAGDILKQRIFSPLAYANVRTAKLIAIAGLEAPRYAAHYPIAWRKRDEAYELVIVRSLLPDGRGHPPGTLTALAFLPVLARAYPFLLGPAKENGARAKLVDTAIADEPGDIGAPIALVDGRPSKATVQRIALLESSAPHFARTVAIARQLAELDLFEPWPLRFDDVEGHTLDVPDLWIVRQEVVSTGALAPVMRAHGTLAADLIGLHRLSLYRAGMLLAHARAALKGAAAPASAAEPAERHETAGAPE
jgi:hypothetical protein